MDDSFKYPTHRFGYPHANRTPQPVLAPPPSPPSQNLSNGVTQSLNASTWSSRYELNRRPSLAQYSNRYEQHAKDGFAYWPPDPYYKKPRCKFFVCRKRSIDRLLFVSISGGTGTTGTYKTCLGLSDAILKL